MNKEINLYNIKPDRKYWVIRSGVGGRYVNHFRRSCVTAIGHADKYISEYCLDKKNFDKNGCYFISNAVCVKIIESHLESASKDPAIKKGQAKNINGQIRRFLLDLKVNDIIITVSGENEVMAGRVLSDPYISVNPIHIPTHDYEKSVSDCNYCLRRTIVWTQRYKRDTLPYIIENSFRNVSTVFEINDKNKVAIFNHWLSPIHISGDTLHLSSRIDTTKSIENKSMTDLSILLDELELLSHNIATQIESKEKINPEKFFLSSDGYTYKLTTQQAFMSPGDHFIQLKGSKVQLYVYAILFASTFNSVVVFANEDDMVFNESITDSIVALAGDIKNKKKFDKTISDLDLKIRPQDEKVLDSNQTKDDLFPKSEASSNIPI